GPRLRVPQRPRARRLSRRDATESDRPGIVGRRVDDGRAGPAREGESKAMTIARRILILAGAAPLVLLALGALTHLDLARIESHSRFVAETQVPSLSALGNISRAFEEMRVALRDHVLAPDAVSRARSRRALELHKGELDELLRRYADGLVSDDRDRRLLDEFKASN